MNTFGEGVAAAPRLAGKTAIVTGSTGGMGAGIALALATAGATVVVSGRRAEQGEQVARQIVAAGGQAIFVRADIAVEEDCVRLIGRAVGHCGRLDLLVNNAASAPVEPAGQQSTALWDQVFAVNVRGVFVCCREAIPAMRRSGGGRIVNIGTTVPFRGGLNRLAYGCSKGALVTMTKMLARDLVRDRILVNWITVGWVATPGEVAHRDQIHGDGAAYLQQVSAARPLGRLETVEDIAAGVLFLASDEASHVTGCELNISGGLWV